MHDVAEFLHRHPPFEGLGEDEMEVLAAGTEVEYFASGTPILAQREGPLEHVWVVRRGSVELVDNGAVLDVLGEGEMFGHPSMLSGQPANLEVRAAEDTLCYRLPAESVKPLLAAPAGLSFVAQSLLAQPQPGSPPQVPIVDPGRLPAARLLRGPAVICDPDSTIREAVALMKGTGPRAVLVRAGEGRYGIVTDRDLRRVVSGEIPADAPVSAAMTMPVASVEPETPGSSVVLEMLERGIRHVPVISANDEVLGVLSDLDLLAAQTQTPFSIRRAIDDARDLEELAAAGQRVGPTVLSLDDAGVPTAQVSAILAIVVDALSNRFFELGLLDLGPSPAPISWFALGSQGRREPVPSSDIDSALAWSGDEDDDEAVGYAQALGTRIVDALAQAGFSADSHGVNAARPQLQRSADSWRRAIRHAIENPDEEKALILVSLLADGRCVCASGEPADILAEVQGAGASKTLLQLMLRLAMVHKPPTGFIRDFVVESSGEHVGKLDIKHGGVLTITSIARYAALASGERSTSTTERLRLAAEAGTLTGASARTLQEAFDLFTALRFEHQVAQLRAGAEPDDYLDPRALNSLTRRYLRDAFNEVRSVQRQLGKGLSVEQTFG